MIESRCGIKCNDCGYMEKVNCTGCVNILKPFWGDCSVKTCCENKGLENCGLCVSFPCDILNQFAYDTKEGDDGARISRCECWCKGVK